MDLGWVATNRPIIEVMPATASQKEHQVYLVLKNGPCKACPSTLLLQHPLPVSAYHSLPLDCPRSV